MVRAAADGSRAAGGGIVVRDHRDGAGKVDVVVKDHRDAVKTKVDVLVKDHRDGAGGKLDVKVKDHRDAKVKVKIKPPQGGVKIKVKGGVKIGH